MPDLRRPATLLRAQALLLGITLAFLIIPGNAIFLEAQGADRLPFAYIGIAVAGTAVSARLNTLQARVGLFRLGVLSCSLVAAVVVAAWLLLVLAGRSEAALVVLVVAAVHGQLGFAFIGAQAGRMFDVQEIKRAFPRIVSGFVAGFMVGGAAADPLVRAFGDASHLLVLASLAIASFAMLVRRAGTLVDVVEPRGATGRETEPEQGGQPLRQLLRVPLVGAVFAYQVLSTMGTQLVEYLLYERAAARFSGSTELASFLGRYTFGLNLADLVVLVVLGGWVMSRYGLRLGVAANPVAVSVLMFAALLTGTSQGIDSLALFALIAAARILDMTMADAATRTSINATFQALPQRQRLPAQLGVEGAGVPVALGMTAVVVLAVNSRPGVNTVGILVATAVVCVLWSISAVVVFLRYRQAVVSLAQRGLLAGPDLDPTEPATFAALLRMAAGERPDDVVRALSLLEAVHDDRVTERLVAAVAHEDGRVRAVSLRMLAVRAPDRVVQPALDALAHGDARGRLAAARVLGGLDGEAATTALRDLAHDGDGTLRAVGLAGLLRRSSTHVAATEVVAALAVSTDPAERVCAARAVGESGLLLGLLGPLLADDEVEVRTAAGGATAMLGVEGQVVVFDQVAAACDVEAVHRFLRNADVGPDGALCRALVRWLAAGHARDRRALHHLAASGWLVDAGTRPALETLVHEATDHLASALDLLARLGGGADPRPAVARLQRALGAEVAAARTRLLATVAPLAGPAMALRAGQVLDGTRAGDTGMALESLDMTLPRELRRPILEVLRASAATAEPPTTAVSIEVVRRLCVDVDWAAHGDWLQACALAVLRELDVAVPSNVQPIGPVAAELCH